MADISINIPYSGTFNNTATVLQEKQDIVQLDLNRFVAYFHQDNQALGYIGIFDFDDFQNSNNFTVTRQELLFYTDITAARIFKLSTTRALVVRDRDVAVLDFTATDVEIALEETAFFTKGVEELDLTYIINAYQGFNAWNLVDNELIVLENEASTSAGTVATQLKLWRIVYDPVGNTLTKTELLDFNDGVTITSPDPTLIRGIINAEITEIPNSAFYHFNLSTSLSTDTVPRVVYAARINAVGQVQNTIPIPTADGFIARNSVSIDDTTTVYHGTAGVDVRIWDGNIFNQVLQLDFTSDTSTEINQLIPIDISHYFIRYAYTSFRVIKVTTNSIIENNNFVAEYANFQHNKQGVQKYDNETYVGYGNTTTFSETINGTPTNFIQFNIYRIYQPA